MIEPLPATLAAAPEPPIVVERPTSASVKPCSSSATSSVVSETARKIQ